MTPARRQSDIVKSRQAVGKPYGRVTKDDIRAANLRRWDGRARVTTDWVHVFNEPELYFPSGDVLVYLREPGQSSRGPAFRIHKSQMRSKGFERILEKCIERVTIPGTSNCMLASCPGCVTHEAPAELYMPAPSNADLDTVFDHHISTRNFFAWLYDLPLAGRALGQSLVALKERINFYRPNTSSQTAHQVVSFADSQRYLDFRECVDHALAALLLAESLQITDLWVDAFAHCVGLSHRGLHSSVEYLSISSESRILIRKAQVEMEARTERVHRSIANFFENDLSSNFLGIPQEARDHFDRFRSWLHSFYIEQYGFWPPDDFDDESVQRDLLANMYSDFRNLYHHLVDTNSTTSLSNDLSSSGGFCTLQNVQAFDSRHKYEPLPQPLPMLPLEPNAQARSQSLQRRQSWNPIARRKVDKDTKRALRMQALIKASNRDWNIMSCLLVRRYSEFEAQTVLDEMEKIPMVEGRKIRWILVYTILQTLISVMQAPKQVRNTEGLSYWLCCQAPKAMPWSNLTPQRSPPEPKLRLRIEPDLDLLHSNLSGDLPSPRSASGISHSERRQPPPIRVNSSSSIASTASRASSLRDFISRRKSGTAEVFMPPKSAPYCEILVRGYGNGLKEGPGTYQSKSSQSSDGRSVNNDDTPKASSSMSDTAMRPMTGSQSSAVIINSVPDLTPASSTSVSRESSNASNSSSNWSKNSTNSNTGASSDCGTSTATAPTPTQLKPGIPLRNLRNSINKDDRPASKELNEIVDQDGFRQTLHMNTQTWDDFLKFH